jgi:hypothetical protein
MKTDLDAFESKLLAELQQHVAERSATYGLAEERPRHLARPRLVLVAAGAAAAVAAVVVIPDLGSSPAYSVDEGNAGQIHIEINRPEDASGLQRALQKHGIAADITYLSMLQTCAPGRYTVVERNLHGMSTNIGERSISVTLPPGAVQDGETFVLTWSVLSMSADELKAAGISSGPGTEVGAGFRLSINADIATGPVKPCEPVSATPP